MEVFKIYLRIKYLLHVALTKHNTLLLLQEEKKMGHVWRAPYFFSLKLRSKRQPWLRFDKAGASGAWGASDKLVNYQRAPDLSG